MLRISAIDSQRPCDILGAAGNLCVAAHSTVRALYVSYAGPLYTVLHTLTNRSEDVHVLQPGGFADVRQHEAMCPHEGDCVISRVIDQTGNGNHLAPRDDRGCPGYKPGMSGHLHNPVDASRHKIHVGAGNTEVYGMYFDPGMGYKNNKTKGIATGDETETMYAVMAGNRWGNGCCFDYGNSEVGAYANGAGSMEAIFFGAARWRGNQGYAEPGCKLADPMLRNSSGTNRTICDGSSPERSKNCCGPWLGADLESGMYYGGGKWGDVNERNKPLRHDFVSLMLKGRHDGFALKGGDASGTFATMYDGPRPTAGKYTPARKEGAIILGTGGDQSNGDRGNFYEGYMVTGVTTDATDDAVQADIAAVGYKLLPAAHCVEVGTSPCYHDSPNARIMGDVVSASRAMTREECIETCFGRGKKLAGVENGGQCMCGNTLTATVPSTNCTATCPGSDSEICGGYMAINILNFTCHY